MSQALAIAMQSPTVAGWNMLMEPPKLSVLFSSVTTLNLHSVFIGVLRESIRTLQVQWAKVIILILFGELVSVVSELKFIPVLP